MRAGGPRTQAWASLVLALCRFLCLVRIDRVRLIVGILSSLPRTVREPPWGSIVGDTTAELHLRRDHQGAAMKKKTVFISYSTKDKEIAAKVKAALEERGIEVTIDRESMRAGGNIRDFIDNSIRNTEVTLSIVSENSLASDWVAFESVESFAAEKIGPFLDDAGKTCPQSQWPDRARGEERGSRKGTHAKT